MMYRYTSRPLAAAAAAFVLSCLSLSVASGEIATSLMTRAQTTKRFAKLTLDENCRSKHCDDAWQEKNVTTEEIIVNTTTSPPPTGSPTGSPTLSLTARPSLFAETSTDAPVSSAYFSYSVVETCQADADGYAGITTDDEANQYVVLYTFGMETKVDADLVDALTAVQSAIEHVLIRHFLPETCTNNRTTDMNSTTMSNSTNSSPTATTADATTTTTTTGSEQRRHVQEESNSTNNQSQTHVDGFLFEPEIEQISVTCDPLVEPDAVCGIYEGVLIVYGQHGGVLAVIQEFLSMANVNATSSSSMIHESILRVFSSLTTSQPTINVDDLEAAGSDGDDKKNGKSVLSNRKTELSTSTTIAIAVSATLAFLGIVGLLILQRRRRRQRIYQNGNMSRSIMSAKIYLTDVNMTDVNMTDLDDDLRSVASAHNALGDDPRPPIYMRDDDF